MIVILTGLLVLTASCEKEEETGYSGIVVFSSEPRADFYIGKYGFSFEKGKNISCGDLYCTGADIIAVNYIFLTEVDSVILKSPSNDEAFHLEGNFSSENEASAFFDAYSEVTATGFGYSTGALEANQVWTFRSLAGRYAKFRIMEITIYNEATYPYAEVKVEYQYQPEETNLFGN